MVTSNTGPILVFPLIQPFGSDESSSLGKVYSRQATESVNCENSSVSFVMIAIEILQYKICSICLVVITFQLVLMCRIIIQKYVCLDHTWHERWTRLSSHTQRVPFCRDKIQILHTFLRLLRKDSAELQKYLCEKQFQSFQSRRNSVSTIFHHLCFEALLWTMDSWLGRLGVRFLRMFTSFSQRFCPIHLVDCLHQ